MRVYVRVRVRVLALREGEGGCRERVQRGGLGGFVVAEWRVVHGGVCSVGIRLRLVKKKRWDCRKGVNTGAQTPVKKHGARRAYAAPRTQTHPTCEVCGEV